MDAFVEALVDLAEEQGGDGFLVQLRNQARAKILEGGGEISAVTAGTVNGKSVSQTVKMDAAELFTACQQALRRYRGEEATVTYADFSDMS